MLICGIDDAGRGPMIGPMVIAGVLIDSKDEEKLAKIGAKDSKLLTPEKREEVYKKITAVAKSFSFIILTNQQIDAALNDPDLNLNWLEANTMAEVTNELKPEKVIIDCPSTNIEAFTEYFKKQLNIDCKIISEHKADANHPSVAAASIIAKVTRDKEIEKIKKKVGENFGSGYPADPITKEFLKKNYEKHADIFRKTWSSYKKVAEEKNQKNLGEF